MAEHKQQSDQEEVRLKNWLDNLQQESWQLELLISGFVLFLLIGGWGPLTELEYDLELLRATSDAYFAFNFIYYVLRTAYLSLLVCLLFHVVLKLRGAFTLGERFNKDADYPLMLKAMGEIHQLYINDSLHTELRPLFHFHPTRAQPGLQYMIPVHDLPPGRHQLTVQSRTIVSDSLRWSTGRTIYFYK
jgi:hypothetical protein